MLIKVITKKQKNNGIFKLFKTVNEVDFTIKTIYENNNNKDGDDTIMNDINDDDFLEKDNNQVNNNEPMKNIPTNEFYIQNKRQYNDLDLIDVAIKNKNYGIPVVNSSKKTDFVFDIYQFIQIDEYDINNNNNKNILSLDDVEESDEEYQDDDEDSNGFLIDFR